MRGIFSLSETYDKDDPQQVAAFESKKKELQSKQLKKGSQSSQESPNNNASNANNGSGNQQVQALVPSQHPNQAELNAQTAQARKRKRNESMVNPSSVANQGHDSKRARMLANYNSNLGSGGGKGGQDLP